MRLYLSLIAVAIFTAFITGYFALSLQGSYAPSDSDQKKIFQLKEEFKASTKPDGVLNIGSYYPSIDHLQLLDQVNELDKNTKVQIYSTNKDCFLNFPTGLTLFKNQKALIWEQFRCGLNNKLPDDFFYIPPYMHPSGKSYAFLAYSLGNAPFNQLTWIKNNLNIFHISELRSLNIKIKGTLGILKDFESYSIHSILDRKERIFTKDFYLVKNNMLFASPYEYFLYSKDKMVKFLKNSDYSIENFIPGKKCFLKDGEVCWEYSLRHLFNKINLNTIVFFVCSILIIVLVVSILVAKIKEQRIEQERKKLALQVLTHEFRTPISSLILEVEGIKKNFSLLTPPLQESFLRVSSDVFRLQRLAEKSRNYLKIQRPEKLIDFNLMKMSSFNEWFSFIIDHYKEDCEFLPLKEDLSGYLDPYWIEISLKNLIENALDHGEKPLRVILSSEQKRFKVTVEDQGECQFQSLDEMCREFAKGKNSSGTGLGLNIVKKAIREMGGDLKFQNKPTRFILEIPIIENLEVKNG